MAPKPADLQRLRIIALELAIKAAPYTVTRITGAELLSEADHIVAWLQSKPAKPKGKKP